MRVCVCVCVCVPLRCDGLQRLFARLQCLEQRAVQVGELTAAFGWRRNEEIQQHDVQELNRVLFDALEQVRPSMW